MTVPIRWRRSLFPALWLFSAAAAGPGILVVAQQPTRDAPIAKPPVPGTAVIAGVVLSDETPPKPLRKARVMLNAVDRSGDGRTATTDDSGRFVFRDLPAGRFTLRAEKPAYIRTDYGAKRPGRPGTPLSISAGQKIVDLEWRVPRGGVITGTVRDQSGTPVPGADVYVMRFDVSHLTGGRMLATEDIARTDDRGVYRAWGLPPGDYVVVSTPGSAQGILPGGRSSPGMEELRRLTPADVQRALALVKSGPGLTGGAGTDRGQLSLPAPGPPVNYAPVYHPDAISLADASTITLAAAEERSGADVQLRLVPTSKIDGSVVLPSGVQPQSISVTLTYSGTTIEVMQGFGLPQTRTTRLNPAGQFSFVGVTPGRYTILARTQVMDTSGPRGRGGAPLGPPVREASTAPNWWALAELDVAGQDFNVPLELQPAMTVEGRLVFEGTSPPPANLTGIRGHLLPRGAAGNLGAGAAGGQVDSQGRFRFTGVTPDEYRLMWFGSPAPWVRRSATALGVDLIDNPLVVKPGMTNIELTVTYTDRPTEVGGTLQDTSGRPASDYFIVVFSVDRSLWAPQTRRVQTVRPATDGAYSVQLLAGEYFIAALTDLEPGDTNDPAFLEKLIPGAIKLVVADGEKRIQDIKIKGLPGLRASAPLLDDRAHIDVELPEVRIARPALGELARAAVRLAHRDRQPEIAEPGLGRVGHGDRDVDRP
jgi:hypothetical protein